ncbi:RNA-directed DNA polymerase, eukaryota [Tanacetum coccineum]
MKVPLLIKESSVFKGTVDVDKGTTSREVDEYYFRTILLLAAEFNSFISAGGLVEVPSGGYSFTWVHKSAAKMSKLDRFLISKDLMRMLKLAKKLKILKGLIRSWVKDKKDKASILKNSLKKKIADIDALLDNEIVSPESMADRSNAMNDLINLEKIESIELAQKAKLKWSNEGDENSKNFHGCINKKRNNMAICGVIVDGQWIEDPLQDCGSNKSPSPDGFTFDFYRKFWYLIEENVVAAVNHFYLHGYCQKGSNSSFIALIPKYTGAKMVKDFRPIMQSAFIANRQILDGPFIYNEIINWCNARKKQSMIFKVDIEKAFDFVSWDFLDDILMNFGFSSRWRFWIQSCLKSSRGSILVNGSPTSEFQFHKGLKQGNPLSPLLFILVMESLHLSFQNVISAGLFKVISLGSNFQLSHLFYADDVVFLGQWSNANLSTIIHVLECFFRASGLRINLHKSKLIGIAVDSSVVHEAANVTPPNWVAAE